MFATLAVQRNPIALSRRRLDFATLDANFEWLRDTVNDPPVIDVD